MSTGPHCVRALAIATALEVCDLSVSAGPEGVEAAVAALSGYVMDPIMTLSFGAEAAPAIRARQEHLAAWGWSLRGAGCCRRKIKV